MSVQNILEALDREIANLTQARAMLVGLNGSSVGTHVNGTRKRVFSAASQREMSAAQRARWARHALNGKASPAKPSCVMSSFA